MNKEEEKEFDKFWEQVIKYHYELNFETGDEIRIIKDIKQFLSKALANQRKEIKKDLLKIADKGEMEELRTEVERYFK